MFVILCYVSSWEKTLYPTKEEVKENFPDFAEMYSFLDNAKPGNYFTYDDCILIYSR